MPCSAWDSWHATQDGCRDGPSLRSSSGILGGHGLDAEPPMCRDERRAASRPSARGGCRRMTRPSWSSTCTESSSRSTLMGRRFTYHPRCRGRAWLSSGWVTPHPKPPRSAIASSRMSLATRKPREPGRLSRRVQNPRLLTMGGDPAPRTAPLGALDPWTVLASASGAPSQAPPVVRDRFIVGVHGDRSRGSRDSPMRAVRGRRARA